MNKEGLCEMLHPMKLIGLGGNQALAERIASALGKLLLGAVIQHFSDGEIQVNITRNVRDRDVYVIQSVQDPVDENLTRLMIVLDALRRASAYSANVVTPYMAYPRQDAKNRSCKPIAAKLLANLLQLTDIDDLAAIDLHASRIQGFHNTPVDHLCAMPILAQYFLDNGIVSKDDDDVVVVSPDHSGTRLAHTFGSYFDAPIAVVDRRGACYDTEAHDMIGDVKDKTIIIANDLTDTGSRIASSTKSALAAGAKKVYATATHVLSSQNAIDVLNRLPAEQIVVTDTIRHRKYPDRMVCLSVIRLLARGIDYIYNDKLIHQILDEQNRTQG